MKKQTENERKKEKWSKRKCGKVNEQKKNIYDQVFKEAKTHTHTHGQTYDKSQVWKNYNMKIDNIYLGDEKERKVKKWRTDAKKMK